MKNSKFFVGLIVFGILAASLVGGHWSTGYADDPLPTIPVFTSLVPTIVNVGGPQFEITITGQNFIDPTYTVVRWLGPDNQLVDLTTTFVSLDGMTLKANVPASLITQIGIANLWVVNHPGTINEFEIAGPLHLTIEYLIYLPIVRK